MTVENGGLGLRHVAWWEWEYRDHRLPYVYAWWSLVCTADVINPRRHRGDQIAGRWVNDKEADAGRRRVGHTPRAKTAEVKVIDPNRWTNSCLMAKEPLVETVSD